MPKQRESQNLKTFDPMYLHKENAVVMTTCNRYDLLKKTVDSYLSANLRPKALLIFDDCSSDKEKIREIFDHVDEANVFYNKHRKFLEKNNLEAITAAFNMGADTVTVLDSDCIMCDNWWLFVQKIIERIDLKRNVVGICNLAIHGSIESFYNGMVFKQINGGLGLIISKEIWNGFRSSKIYNHLEHAWDTRIGLYLFNTNTPLLSLKKSIVQHTGVSEGAHATANCIASDFSNHMDFDDDMFKVNTRFDFLKKKHRIPDDFSPNHPNWTIPSVANRFKAMMTEYDVA